MPDEPSPPAPPGEPAGLLRCANCGRVTPCTLAELLGYVGTEWPECCDQTMTLYMPGGPADR